MTLHDLLSSTPEGRDALAKAKAEGDALEAAARLNLDSQKAAAQDPDTFDLALRKHIETAHGPDMYSPGEDLMVVHHTAWPNCYDEFEYYTPMTDADFGEFEGKAICRECGNDLPEDLVRYEIEYHPDCAGLPDEE